MNAADELELEQEPFEPSLPGVNVLPEAIRQSIAIGKARTLLIIGIALVVAATGAVWMMQAGAISQAEQTLTDATARNTELNDQVAALAPAKQLYNEITTLQELIATTLADQPRAREVLDALDRVVIEAGGRPQVDILTATVEYTGVPAPGEPLTECPNPDPFKAEPTIGCLSFSAVADSRTQVSNLLRALEADPLFVGPFVTSSTATGADEVQAGLVTFTGSAGISLDGLQTPLTAEEIEVLENPPAPAPTEGASPEPSATVEGATP